MKNIFTFIKTIWNKFINLFKKKNMSKKYFLNVDDYFKKIKDESKTPNPKISQDDIRNPDYKIASIENNAKLLFDIKDEIEKLNTTTKEEYQKEIEKLKKEYEEKEQNYINRIKELENRSENIHI